MAVIPSGYAQVNLKQGGTALPNKAETTFGLRVDDPGLTPAGVAALVRDEYNTTVRTYHSIAWELESVLVKFGPNASGPFAEVSAGLTGDGTGDAISPQVAILVEKVTGIGGRRGRGRLYMPGVPENAIDNGGVVDPANVTALAAAWEDFRTGLVALDLVMVLLHSDGVLAPTVITSLDIDARSATQRRRQRG